MVGKEHPEYVQAAPSVVVHTIIITWDENCPVPGHQVPSVTDLAVIRDMRILANSWFFARYIIQNNFFQRSKAAFWWEAFLPSVSNNLIPIFRLSFCMLYSDPNAFNSLCIPLLFTV